ncbi:hypothetical protein BC826DRAFT_695034 [Russula brevipes]|nr:hypothetical protein BC826DRAFT_695034 [Russula brevipes]
MTLDSTLATLFSETFLLLLMLAGLLRQRDHHLGRFLFCQGLIWLCVAIVSQVPQIVLLSLDLTELGNQMFHSTSLLSMTICVTRLYRALITYPSTQKSANPSSFLPTGVRIKFASFHSDDRNAESEATGVTTSFQVSEAPSDASDGTAREPKSATRNAFRESDAV